MSRQLLGVITLAAVLAGSITPASAFVSYTSNVSLRAQVPFATYVAPGLPTYAGVNPSIFTPGGPVLGAILDTWNRAGNALYYGSPIYGNYFNTLYSRYAYGNYYTTSSIYGTMRANYRDPVTGVPAPVANYTSGSAVVAAPAGNYSDAAAGKSQPTAAYSDAQSHKSNAQGNYTNPATASLWPSANYTASAKMATPTAVYSDAPAVAEPFANYSKAVESKQPTGNYVDAPVVKTPTANYSAPAKMAEPTANYVSTSAATSAPTANYIKTSASQETATANYSGGTGVSRQGEPTATYVPVTTTGGAAFGSLFGDGRTTAYGTTARDSFLARLRGQSATNYTSRADALSAGNYNDLYNLNPSISPLNTSGKGLDFSVNYDRPFGGASLNATPTSQSQTPGQAVAGAIRSLEMQSPIVMNSSYEQDVHALQAKGILPASWGTRAGTTTLTRRDVAQILVRVRAWRETGDAGKTQMNKTTPNLPIIGDLKNTDTAYDDFMRVAQQRIMYMPELREENGVVTYAKADAGATAQRAQTLQGVMTALYLRPDATLIGSSYRDVPKESWYSSWAATAQKYGVTYGTKFEPAYSVTQAEMVHMIAELLKQFR